MLTAETKNRINTCRDILVGKIPDPKGQIEQITNALIYKFMDDQDMESVSLGGRPSHFTGELEDYAWHKLFDPKLNNQEKADKYREGLEKLATSNTLPDFFREVFKNTYLPFRDANTISMFIKEINHFEYKNEELGNAFEFLLQIMGSQGDAGQFRTPRNIIEFIVDAIDPGKSEKILDPACGTAGFLVESYIHLRDKGEFSPSEKKELAGNFKGVDIDPGMAKIARVNLYLHGFASPQITEDDTLSNEALWDEKYDIILANPPFMTPKGGITPHKKFSVSSSRAEVLFVDYIAEHLRLDGRAGIIVPEGIIFQSGTAYKSLRKMLVENGLLWAVVSLPAGVFQPYSGVKTSILLLDRKLARNQENILFIKIQNDGFDLGAQRRAINKNDLPEALRILKEFKLQSVGANFNSPVTTGPEELFDPTENGEHGFAATINSEIAHLVPKTQIAQSGDYNLSGDRYKTAAVAVNTEWPMVEVGELCKLGRGRVISKIDMEKNPGDFPVFSSQTSNDGIFGYLGTYDFDGEYVTWTTDGANAGTVFYRNGKFNCTNVCGTLKATTDQVNMRYLALVLNSEAYKHVIQVGNPKLMNNVMAKIKIPLPPLEVQQQIIDEIEVKQKVIEGAKQVIENAQRERSYYTASLATQDWPRVKLGDLGEVRMCKRIFKNETKTQGDVPFYKIGTFGKSPDAYINQDLFDLYSKKFFYPKKGDILISTSGTIGKTVIFDGQPAYFQDSNIVWIEHDQTKILNSFMNFLFENINWNTSKGVTIERLYNKNIQETSIILPPLEIQQQIVDQIQAEQVLVDGNKKLIEIYEQKIKDKIDSIWGN